jgi:hypothetical protein
MASVQLSHTVSIQLCPWNATNSVPFDRILEKWIGAEFSRPACEEILRGILDREGIPRGWFNPRAIRSGGLVASNSVLYARGTGRWLFRLEAPGLPVEPFGILIPKRVVRDVAATLHVSFQARTRKAHGSGLGAFITDFDRFCDSGETRPAWDDDGSPGIFRREHASLLVRSRKTSILVDPIYWFRALGHMQAVPLDRVPAKFDAVVVTHSHGDHWHVPSILHAVRGRDIPVIVPRVPRVNLLTPDRFADTLRGVGARVCSARWGSTVTVGDIEIDVLPFYGEQPTRDPPGPAQGLRSWGNCYRFNTPDFSAIILVDGGKDPMGDMSQVLRASASKRGPADVVLSCLRLFPSPFFGGLETYWAALPFSRLEQLYRTFRSGGLPSTTAGPAGVADACVAAQARFFLPYAHGFEGVGKSIRDVDWNLGGPSEDSMVAALKRELDARGGETRTVRWVAGDVARIKAGEMRIHASTPSPRAKT